MRAAGGEEIPVSVVVVAHPGDGDEPESYSCIARDASERQSFERRLVHDPLTGLANRVLFVDRLEHALARSDRRTSTLAVICLDLDRFKVVNDSLGHDAGDELLVAVAERVGYVLRDEDSAARFGSDEFVLFCEDIRSEEQAMAVVARVRAAFAKPFRLRGTELHVTACIGLALATRDHLRPADVLRDAAAALSRAKERGSAHVELFDEAMRLRAVRRLELGTALHRAVEQGELRIHYQPEVNLVDGTISGLEALVRWDHPLEGLLSPTEFIPLAEDNGLIDAIGEFVFADACEQAVRWNARADRKITVWVNLSARQLAGPDIVSRVASILAATGADPSTLGLEITESVLFEDVDAAVETLHRLRALGVRLGVDDFGTGYSSLTYLKRLPVEMVKIDRSFVDGVGTDPESTAIVAAVVSMSRALGLVTVAEGAENTRQIAALRTLGCSVAQGYYFSPPSDPDAIEMLLASSPPPWAATISEPLKAPPAAPAPIPSQRDASRKPATPLS
jgi:diguanylate cyclase (GGDEF)-like protein